MPPAEDDSEIEETATEAEGRRGRPSARGETAPHLFVVLHCDAPWLGGARVSLEHVDEVVITRGKERSIHREDTDDGRVLTIRIPGKLVSRSHARIQRVLDAWVLVDNGSTNGVFVNERRVKKATLADGDVIECAHTLFVLDKHVPVTPLVARPPDRDLGPAELARLRLPTLSPSLEARTDVLRRVATSGLPMLILGESGTGKEVVARAVAEMSGRSGAFVPVNCGAIPPGLLESQLFGHVKGAFSGATRDESGFFRAAEGGTLFLDEIGDLPSSSQVAFLRVLEDGIVTPVGTTRGNAVDVRIIAATNRPLGELVNQGVFREDLLARLSTFVEHLVPLRERRHDIGVLVAAILPQLARLAPTPVPLTVEAGHALLTHRWPLNVRELRAALSSAIVVAGEGPIAREHLPLAASSRAADPPPLGEGTRDRLVRLLTEHQGNVASVARAAGKAPAQIHRWLKQYALDVNSFRPPK